jgi:F-type H+-transporting ATPase subunit b
MQIVHQLGELFLQAVPTILILLVFYLVLRALFFKPLLRVMDEREARTSGARREAEVAQAAAAGKVKQYQDALRHERGEVYKEQEAARKKLLDERAAQLKEARSKAALELATAKERVAKDLLAARQDVEASIGALSAEIVRRVLQNPPRPSGTGRDAQ